MLTTFSKIVLRGGLECYGKVLVLETTNILLTRPLAMAPGPINFAVRRHKILPAVGIHITTANVIQLVLCKSPISSKTASQSS
jgi:hypothetical protein